ncbi:hypothetical protein G9A89_004276 [Geosiphon pyriformis]|nr:hypothetical protein G9A89_004276 [Geosiphon pyriformis]
MIMEENKTETLEKRVTRLGEELSKKIESYLIPNPRKNTYQPLQKRSQEVSDSRNNRPSRQEFRTETRVCHFLQMQTSTCQYHANIPPRTPAQTPKKTVTQSIKKQRIYSPEDKSYHFSPENKIQIPLGAASSSTSTPQTPRTPSYIDKIKQRNWGDIPITGGYSSLFQNPLFQPKFRMGFENREEKSESESEKETSEKTITRPVTGTSSQFRNQETRDQEEEPDIREATFRNAQGNIIPSSLKPINPPAENGNEMTTPYIARLTDFSGEEEETDMHTWLREAQKAIQQFKHYLSS